MNISRSECGFASGQAMGFGGPGDGSGYSTGWSPGRMEPGRGSNNQSSSNRHIRTLEAPVCSDTTINFFIRTRIQADADMQHKQSEHFQNPVKHMRHQSSCRPPIHVTRPENLLQVTYPHDVLFPMNAKDKTQRIAGRAKLGTIQIRKFTTDYLRSPGSHEDSAKSYKTV